MARQAAHAIMKVAAGVRLALRNVRVAGEAGAKGSFHLTPGRSSRDFLGHILVLGDACVAKSA